MLKVKSKKSNRQKVKRQKVKKTKVKWQKIVKSPLLLRVFQRNYGVNTSIWRYFTPSTYASCNCWSINTTQKSDQSGKLWSNLPFLESLPFLEGFSIYGYAPSKNGYADDVIVPKYRKCCAYVGTYRFPPNMRQMRLSPLVAFYSP